jgi:YD repeat-containing protein
MNGSLTTKTLTAATGPATGTDFSYNAAGQVASATDPTGHTTHYTYSPDGQLATVAGPDGTLTTYTYDQATGRLKEKDIRGPDGTSQDTGYTYYAATGLVKTVDDPAHPSDVIGYDYDADGHLTQLSYPDGASTKASYHDNGELATTTDITGAVTSFTYNTDGSCGPSAVDLCRASQARDGATLASVAYTYDSLDRLHTVTGGNKVTTTLAYTDASQIKTQTTTAADGSTLRADRYTYDAHSNVATHTITSRLAARAASGQAARRAATGPAVTTTSYHYDAYNRLISSAVYPGDTATGTPDTTTSYTVNTAGDVTAQDITTAGKTTRVTDTIDHGQLTARTSDGTRTEQTFNADGAVTQDLAGNNYTYTLAGQIASVTTPAGITTKYTYWPDGTRRAATTSADGTDHVITYHYATGGQVANDTYTGAAAGTAGPAIVTASYLVAAGRGPHPGRRQYRPGHRVLPHRRARLGHRHDRRPGSGRRQLRLLRLRPAHRAQYRLAAHPSGRPGRQRRRQPVYLRRRLHRSRHRHPVPARPHLRPVPGALPQPGRRQPAQPLPGLRHQPQHRHRPDRPAGRPADRHRRRGRRPVPHLRHFELGLARPGFRRGRNQHGRRGRRRAQRHLRRRQPGRRRHHRHPRCQ